MDERDHSERQAVAWSTSEKSKNDVAYPVARAPHDPGIRRRSGISDSKYNDAAVLAIDLASATSWSDTVLPSAAHTQESDLVNTSMSIQHTHHSPDCRFSGQNHLGPPPEYTPSDERDLTPESGSSSINDMHEQPSQPEMSESTRLEDGLRESDQHPGPDAPLLDDFDEKAPEGRRQWMRKKGAESSPRRHLRGLRILIGLILLLSIIAAAFKYHRTDPKIDQFARNLPLISTEKVHVQHSSHENIRGRFELRDTLDLSTTTGSIDIEVDPQPDPHTNDTLSLNLSSSTGSITLTIASSWWFRKDKPWPTINTRINTVTGPVYARILLGHGGSASVTSVSGPQDLRVYLYGASTGDPVSYLSTKSHIGEQVIALTNLGGYDATIDTLIAEHRSLGTANIECQYSRHWRGRVRASSSPVGRVEVQGDVGLVFEEEGEHQVVAHKGKDKNLMNVDVVSEGTGGIVFKSWYTW